MYFLGFGNIFWEQGKLVTRKINEYITQLGENFENVMDTYFEEFKKRMRKRIGIPEELVMKHYNNVCFLVDTYKTFVHAVKLKAWLTIFD